MSTSAEKIRAWQGHPLLGYGFRPFFQFGALWAALAMALWLMMLAGHLHLTGPFDPVSWHAHEMVFGYLPAIMAGFLFTAVPNWTGRMPIVGWPLGILVLLWLIGRVAMASPMPALAIAAIDTLFPLAFLVALGREIIAGKNWRNLPVVVLFGMMVVANLLFHAENARSGSAAGGHGFRLALGAAVMLISVIGGRIVPSFTRNWLAKRGAGRLPTPFNSFDKAALGLTGVALVLWAASPSSVPALCACLVAGLVQFARLVRWAGWRTGAEPLVWVLHVGYAFVPLGFLGLAATFFAPAMRAAAQHVWMAGAIGLMTLAVMTRASLGHSGRALTATGPIALLYHALIVSVVARIAYGLFPAQIALLHVSALGWIAAFAGFGIIYWPMLMKARR